MHFAHHKKRDEYPLNKARLQRLPVLHLHNQNKQNKLEKKTIIILKNMHNLMAIIYTLENVKRFLKHNKVQWRWYKRIRSVLHQKRFAYTLESVSHHHAAIGFDMALKCLSSLIFSRSFFTPQIL